MKPPKVFRLLYKVFVVILLAIVILALVEYDFSPRAVLMNSRIAARSLYQQLRFYYKYYTADKMHEKYEDYWYPASYKATGVTIHDRDKSYDGLTFFSNHDARAFLMDSSGKVVHQWALPFTHLWSEPSHAKVFEPDKLIYWRHARLFPNGDVIAIYEGLMQTPYGLGIVKVNKDSEVIWKSDINAHHDMDIDEEGNIYVLKLDYVINESTGMPFIRDGIAVLSPAGRTLREIDLYGKIVDAGFGNILEPSSIDPVHTNNLDFLDARLAERFPMFEKGDILVSARSPGAVFVLDGNTFEPKWDMQGMFLNQHDPDFLESGMIRVFDNEGNMDKPGDSSRLIEIDPSSKSVVWEYTGTEQEPFVTKERGSHQGLPNGNILITESNKGRLFEITPEGETVWEYISESYDGSSIGILNWAIRYNREDLPFLEDNIS
jgi:hypothetical protein